MFLIKSNSTNPFFNFATEEYFLKNFKEEFFLISFYDESISVGINQNTLHEINAMYVKKNNIKVARRSSGGGTVLHDKGCINYSFIMKDDGTAIDNFRKFSEPILSFFKDKFSLSPELHNKNNIIVEGKKISRMAKYKHNGKFVQHGTLTFLSNFDNLGFALKNNNNLNNNELPIGNINELINDDLSSERFMEMFYLYIKGSFTSAIPYEISKEDNEIISKLAKEKYSSWEWNYGKSPDYDLRKNIKCPSGNIEVFLKVQKGVIIDINIFGDFFSEYDISELENLIKGNKHKCDELLDVLNNIDISKYFGDIDSRFFVENLF